MYRTGYRLLFWGFLVILLSFKFNGFDLFSDVMGYILISAGLHKLAVQHEQYQRALSWSLTLVLFRAVLSAGSIMIAEISYTTLTGTLLLLLEQAVTIGEIIMIYHVCSAFMALAKERNFYRLYESVQFRWRAYFTASATILLLMPFTLTQAKIVTIPLIVLALVSFFAFLLIVLAVNTAVKELAEG